MSEPEPFYSCQIQGCAAEVSYPADMLAVHPNGGVICEGCWDETRGEDAPAWRELQKFTPAYVQRIAELESRLAEAIAVGVHRRPQGAG